ncbi:MAG TPA: choice-of-anchor tandem repeat NxxGxxAF-containing protein, partial [Lacipirellulaceae bacterium]
AFPAKLTGSGLDDTNNTGIWAESSGSLKLVARAGDRAPGTPDGVQFGRMTGITVPTLNAAGQVAFVGTLAGSGVDTSNDLGIWATDVNGSLWLIAREGEQLEVAPSDFRTIRSVSFGRFEVGGTGSGNEDGRPSGFNDRGQLGFTATFTDGSSGVFVSNLVAIPEPATVILIGFVLGAFIGLPRGMKKNRGGRK